MLLQRLRERADQTAERAELTGDAMPPMYQRQPIRYIFTLDVDGRRIGPPLDTADPAVKEKKNGTPRLAPDLKRGFAIKPRLLADNGVYTLRQPDPNGKLNDEEVTKRHRAYVDRVVACAAATGEPTVAAVARFLSGFDGVPEPAALELPADYSAASGITFRVGDNYPIDLQSVRDYWATAMAPSEERGASTAVCIVCGRVRAVLTRHPISIKGIPGGQAQKDLISANEAAYMSYGLENSAVAPTCQECAVGYANALNALLASPAHSIRIRESDLAYAFWTAEPVEFDFATMMSRPDDETAAAAVGVLLTAHRMGQIGALAIDATAFYAVGLGPSGKRAVVRDWMDVSVGEAKRGLARYFALQDIVDWDGSPARPIPLWRLTNATVRDAKTEAPPPLVGRSLIRLAVAGSPLPLELLYLAVRRNRAAQGVNRERAALIKMVLGSRARPGDADSMRGADQMTDLNLASTEPAYLCGRLLAVLDAIQRAALPNVNATIVDRFFGSASSAPSSVFSALVRGAQPHLSTLRRTRRGTYVALDARLQDILEPMGPSFPKTLNVEQQGMFALGFYHQRAADRRASREWQEAREGAGTELATPAAGTLDLGLEA